MISGLLRTHLKTQVYGFQYEAPKPHEFVKEVIYVPSKYFSLFKATYSAFCFLSLIGVPDVQFEYTTATIEWIDMNRYEYMYTHNSSNLVCSFNS